MRRIYVSSLYRLQALGESGGELGKVYVLDWDKKEVLNNPTGVEPGYSFHKPLGRSHGARGITISNNLLYVAGSGSKISYFDLDTYELCGSFEYKELQSLHQLKSKNGYVYAVSTGTDSYFKIKKNKIVENIKLGEVKEVVNPHILEKVKKKRKWGFDILHFNSIGWDSLGDEYHIYFSANMVFNYTKNEIVYKHGLLNTPHDVVFGDNRVFVNSSSNRSTVCIDQGSGAVNTIYTHNLEGGMLESYNSGNFNTLGFTRGLFYFDGSIFVGITPGTIIELKQIGGNYKVVDRFDFSSNVYEAIYDFVFDYRDWI